MAVCNKSDLMNAQASMEYLMVVSIGLLIIGIVAAYVVLVVPSASSVAPGVCNFVEPQISCSGVMATLNQNTGNTLVVMEITNSGQSALSGLSTYLYVGSWNSSSFSCSPSYVPPGASAICEISLSGNVVRNEYLSGYMYSSFNSCGLATAQSAGRCEGSILKYEGSYKVQVQASGAASQADPLTITASAEYPSVSANCKNDNVSSTVKVNGYPLKSASVAFSSNNVLPKIYQQNAVTNSNGIASTEICSYTQGSSTITATFGSYSADTVVTFT